MIIQQHAYLQKFLEDAQENINLVETCYPIDGSTALKLSEPSLPLSSEEGHRYRSYLMTIYYMALRTRPDILLACAMLSTKASCPSVMDWENLSKLVCYLWTNPMVVLTYSKWSQDKIELFIDASWSLYEDSKGQTGGVIKLFGNSIMESGSLVL